MFDIKELYLPSTVAEAVRLLDTVPEALIMAGGSDNLVKLRDGKLGGKPWVSIYQLDELRVIELTDEGDLRIGSLNSFSKVAKNPLVRRHAGSLGEAVLTIGGPQVRNIGTIGGNICNGAPSADSASACFSWEAQVEITGPEGVKLMPIHEFYITVGKVALNKGEIVTAIRVPKAGWEGFKGAHHKYAMRNAMDIATVNCSTTIKLSEDKQTIVDARMAFGVAAPTPIRAPHGEAALKGQPTTAEVVDAAAQAAISDTRARDSWRASKAFREHMLAEMARRCIRTAIKRSGGEVKGASK